jgi:hypothetical protein
MSEIRWQEEPRVAPLPKTPAFRKPDDTLQGWKKEIAGYYQTMFNFIDMDSIEVFQNLSQFSARASEMRSRIPANAARDENNFRIKIIDPFIEECDRQFKLHSRICAILEMEARMSGGVRA